MTWGYALIWVDQFLRRDPDPLIARLKFLAHYGLTTTGIGAAEAACWDAGRAASVGRMLDENGLRLTLHTGLDFFNPDRAIVRRQAAEAVEALRRAVPVARAPLVTTCAGPVHRFMREPSLAAQLEMLAEGLVPLARACGDLRVPFGIENHGDYYVSDLVGLIERVPGLGLFLDTGNTYLVGEAPLPAFELGARYAVGTHFKDHHVAPRPEARPLHFEVGPSVIGEGDVPLRECYRLLMERNPAPDRLVMEIELIPPSFAGDDPVEAFEKSLAFVRSLA
ncbi:MAG: sugar phosphate isomerase/epimerase family protein [Candidatus Coatesbacteria bacterium]